MMHQPSATARLRVVALLVPLALVAAACGQKSGVAGSGEDADGGVTPPTAVVTLAPTTLPPATTAPATALPGSVPSSEAVVDTTALTPATTAAPAPTTAPAPVGPFEPGGDDTAGVSDTEIVIGIHAPVTGASPIPQQSFDTGKDIYWQWLAGSAPDELFGRKVRVVFRDDQFDPQAAVQACREMVEQDGAFLLVGGGGADQITACAQYAADNGIPYLSAGVNENGLTDLDTYFATTLTYAEQAPMMMSQLTAQGITEIGLVVSDTPSFDDAQAAIEAAADEAGVTIAYQTRLNKTAAEAEQLSVVQELKNSGVEAVVLLSSPLVFIGLANQGLNQGFTPTWLGPGVTSGLNAVTTFGCPAVETGEFFSPTPGLDVINQLDADFEPAYAQYGGGAPADDIGLQLWSLNKALALMFEATGPELGRAAFMNTLVTTPEFNNGIYAPIMFTPEQHFGGTGCPPPRRGLRRQAVHDGRAVRPRGLSVGELVHKRAGLLVGLGLALALVVVLVATGEKQALVIGTVTGSAYGLVALGLVLIYKSSGVFNFAQGEFGTVAVCVLYLLHVNDVPYGLAVSRRPPGGDALRVPHRAHRRAPVVRRAPGDAAGGHGRRGAAGDRHRDVVLRGPGAADRAGASRGSTGSPCSACRSPTNGCG